VVSVQKGSRYNQIEIDLKKELNTFETKYNANKKKKILKKFRRKCTVYIDAHEREEILQFRNEFATSYIEKWETYCLQLSIAAFKSLFFEYRNKNIPKVEGERKVGTKSNNCADVKIIGGKVVVSTLKYEDHL